MCKFYEHENAHSIMFLVKKALVSTNASQEMLYISWLAKCYTTALSYKIKKGLVSTNSSQELQGNSWLAECYAAALSYKIKKSGDIT